MGSGQDHEIIVVGAGPAGATTATILAQEGHDVLLIDREDFPRDKTCGDAVPAGAIVRLKHLGMADKIQHEEDAGHFYPLNQLRLVSPKGKVLVAPFSENLEGDSYIAPRIYFDAMIKEHAVDSGAKFRRATVKGPIVENGRVVGVNAQFNGHVEPVRAEIVVGADGVTSTITRALRPDENKHIDHHRAVALRAYIEDLEEYPHEVEFYLYDDILPGYAWIFPLGNNKANIGLGMRLDHFRDTKSNLNKLLQQFLDMPDIKRRLKNGGQLHDVATWQLNFGSQKHLQHTFDGALLVGDAAGFINPLTGGGIHNAIISARLASQTIHNALMQGDTSRENLKVYEKQVDAEMWDSMKRSYFIQRWVLKFPWLVDMLVTHVGENSSLAKTFLSKL